MQYEGHRINPDVIAERLLSAAEEHQFYVHDGGRDEGIPLRYFSREADNPDAMRVYLSAGMHGDEPAGVMAILALLENDALDLHISWFIAPLINPGNFNHNRRHSVTGVDPNRDYLRRELPTTMAHIEWLISIRSPFDIAFCLHEDYEAKGFYLYEHLAEGVSGVGAEIIQATSRITAIDLSPEIDGFPFRKGVFSFNQSPSLPDQSPESRLLIDRGCNAAYTMETPSNRLELEQRAAIHSNAVLTGVRCLGD